MYRATLIVILSFSTVLHAQVEKIKLPPGFKAEQLMAPTKKFGSFTGLAFDDKGNLYACVEKGGLTRFKVPGIDESATTLVGKKINSGINHAHGILFHNGKLYAYAPGGIYVASEQDADGNFSKTELKIKVSGKGGHGQHALVYNPHDKMIYAIAGNACTVADDFSSQAPPVWSEDHLVPRLRDPRGHASKFKAPGATVIRFDEDCKNLNIYAQGMRNPFGLAMDRYGEFFTYDADMEWDMGTPWYRPTRVCHIVSGAEFGWRNGNGKWPEYFHDSLSPVINIGPGSPTHIASGINSKFPTKYRDAIFINDWTYAYIYAIHLKEDGSSYKAEKEIFLQATSLPLTGLTIGPDGKMYMVTGGRGMASEMYRVSYVGKESTQLSKLPPVSDAVKTRRMLESFHGESDPGAIKAAWPYLNSKDRFIRFAARLAIENQPLSDWQARYYSEKDPATIVSLTIAMARHAGKDNLNKMMAKLYPLDFSSLSETNQLALLRAYSLSISRMGSVSESSRNEIIKQLDSHYPNKLKFVNHELSRLLCHLEAKDVISKTLAIMHSAEKESANDQIKELSRRSWKYGKALNNLISETPQTQQIHYARMLTQVKNGWTFAERQQYLSWYKSALSKKGGNSYSGHISNMQKVAIGHIPATERKAFEALIKNPNSAVDLSKLPKAKGPGKAWTIAQVVELEKGNGLKYRNFNNGKKMFAAALCSSCHRFAGEGNSAGPDLTGLGKRFDTTSIMEAIIAPSKFISDQYSTTVITTKDKSVYNGRIKQEEDGIIQLLVNPYDSSMVSEIESKDVTNRDISKVSLMPPGLIYSLNEDELLDLLAYLKSGGNAEHQYFKK